MPRPPIPPNLLDHVRAFDQGYTHPIPYGMKLRPAPPRPETVALSPVAWNMAGYKAKLLYRSHGWGPRSLEFQRLRRMNFMLDTIDAVYGPGKRATCLYRAIEGKPIWPMFRAALRELEKLGPRKAARLTKVSDPGWRLAAMEG